MKVNEISHPYQVVGIDWCKIGWYVVWLSNEMIKIDIFKQFNEILKYLNDIDLILVDIPIGAPMNKKESILRPEQEARKYLKKRGSTMFNVPHYLAIKQDDYKIANEINRRYLDKGLSKQSFYIRKGIDEVNEFLLRNPCLQNCIFEAHPELCFAMLHYNKYPIMEKKKTIAGKEKRFKRLQFIESRLAAFLDKYEIEPLIMQQKEDFFDAFCLAVTAKLIHLYGRKTIPQQPHKNSQNLTMQMVYSAFKSTYNE